MYVDSHQHFWKLARGDYSWMTPDMKKLYKDFFPSDLEPLIKEKNISKTIIVQAADTVAETEFTLKLAEDNEFVAGVVGWVDLESPKTKETIDHIKKWIISYNKTSKTEGFIIGISGGIDSAVTSTILAQTKLPLLCLEMPIHQNIKQVSRGKKHIKWLEKKYENVSSAEIDLTDIFESFKKISNAETKDANLALANTRSRLRMTTLYYHAQINNYLVAGTGNKVEDFGIGFYTKYGDGGVDISPIADLLKSEVFIIGKELEIINEILIAPPTDGLWDNNQTDEEQIGATYDDLEWAMKNINKQELSQKEEKIMNIFKKFNLANKHKMIPIPVCKIPKKLRS